MSEQETKAMKAEALAPGEASMSLRVFRKDGTVEELNGEPVEVNLPAALVAEYKAITKRAREIEALLLEHMLRGE